jgi:hypothetical protein
MLGNITWNNVVFDDGIPERSNEATCSLKGTVFRLSMSSYLLLGEAVRGVFTSATILFFHFKI